jgi:hypothetical protein
MSEIRLARVSSLDKDELRSVAVGLHKITSDPEAARYLSKRRHFPGVVSRHADSPEESIRSLRRARDGMEAGRFLAFALFDDVSRGWVGMATSQPDLPLFRQRVPLPAGLTRNTRLGERRVTGDRNVSAWSYRKGSGPEVTAQGLEDITAAYGQLAALNAMEGASSWTVEPERSLRVLKAIQLAGFNEPIPGSVTRLDDYESAYQPAPLSHYLIYAKPNSGVAQAAVEITSSPAA